MNVARLLAALNLETEPVPDVMKCVECERVLKDACQLPCGCRFCRLCIDAVVARGAQFCPGGSWECGETPLSSAVPDYGTNKSISRLTARCPHAGCAHACPLADMEAHLRACPRKDGATRQTSEHSQDTEVLQRELALKDEQMRTVMDEMRGMQSDLQDDMRSIIEEMRLIKIDIASIQWQLQLKGVAETEGQPDARFDWLIEDDISQEEWEWVMGISFLGTMLPYTFQLSSGNRPSTGEFFIWLHIQASPKDPDLEWPFRSGVTLTVSQRDRREAATRMSWLCRIDRPPENGNKHCSRFKFWHSHLKKVGIDLRRGLCVSCEVFPGATSTPVFPRPNSQW